MDAGRRQALVLIVGLAMSVQAPAETYHNKPIHVPEDSPIRRRLLEPGGPYKGREVNGRNGEKWLGLVRTAAGYRLEWVTLRVITVRHGTEDMSEAAEYWTGKMLTIAERFEALFLMRGFERLAGRSVYTVFDGRLSLRPQSDLALHFGNTKLKLTVASAGRFEPGPNPQDPKVEIFQVHIHRGESLVPLPLVVTESNWATLRWAGDLDGDGRADYLFEDGGGNWTSLRLFLSSAAKPGQVVAEVAQFYHTGC